MSVQRDINARLEELKRTKAQLRVGEVTDSSPLEVALGGSSTSYENVRAINPGAASGDLVAALVAGNDMLVLGTVTDAPLRTVRGIVNTITPTIVEGTGFSISKNGTGDVTVTFDTAFSDVPAVVVTVQSASARLATVSTTTASATQLLGWNTSFAAAETQFHFVAVGPG